MKPISKEEAKILKAVRSKLKTGTGRFICHELMYKLGLQVSHHSYRELALLVPNIYANLKEKCGTHWGDEYLLKSINPGSEYSMKPRLALIDEMIKNVLTEPEEL
jgi:hypothetical protein